MTTDIAQTFVRAIQQLESAGEEDPIVALYAEESECGNVASSEDYRGPDGARAFWTHYRSAFQEVESTFRNVVTADNRVALEWMTRGTGPDGRPVSYEGVTILETSGSKITRSRAYFNPNQTLG